MLIREVTDMDVRVAGGGYILTADGQLSCGSTDMTTPETIKPPESRRLLDRLVLRPWSLDLLVGPHWDTNGIPVLPGDLIRIFHFVARRRKTIWMYKKVFRVDGNNQLADNGDFLTGVALSDVGDKPFDDWHKCLLQHCGEFEVIDGHSLRAKDGALMCWWERPRLPRPIWSGPNAVAAPCGQDCFPG